MIDAIRSEHARVYMQDQALLKTIKEKTIDTNQSIDEDAKSDK
jgi:hypothetical protein